MSDFTTLPDEKTLAATVVALEEHGFSVEVVDDFEQARKAVLARIPHGSSVMTNTSVTLQETGIQDAVNDSGSPYESARNRMMALDYQTQMAEMKAIAGSADYALGSVHAITADGALVIASVGNTGPTENTVEDPGVCLGVLSVGAVDAAGLVIGVAAYRRFAR